MDAEYRINEIFYSIQGEGRNAGMPVVFIRFGECNLDCWFCDTDKTVKAYLNISQVISLITKAGRDCRNVILTGGEPCLQNLGPLVMELKALGYWIGIETNATLDPPWLGWVDWITLSPKGSDFKRRVGNELKIVYHGGDLSVYSGFATQFKYLQPMEVKGKVNYVAAIMAIKENPEWHLSVQLHKMLGIK